MAKEQKQQTGSWEDVFLAAEEQKKVNTVEVINFEPSGEFTELPPMEQEYQLTEEDVEKRPQETTMDVTLYIPETATTEERLSLMSYLGDTEPLWNFQGESLIIIGVVAFDDWKRNENGELLLDEEGALIPCKRTIWKGQLGKLWHSTSNVAYSFAKQKLWPIMGIGGKQGNLRAPVTIKMGSKPTRNGRRTFKFDIVSE